MVFSDLAFLPFFLVVFGAIVLNRYTWKSLRAQNLLYVAASYYFYAQWDWRFLSLLIISTLLDYIVGWQIEHDARHRRRWLALSVTGNLGILGFFKYYNFFVSEAVAGLQSLGIHASAPALNIILPVGISFYTFQTMTYALDIYRGQMKATRDLVAFATYVAFFPQLVAGPIERAANLLEQFERLWRFDEKKFTEGLRLVLFGLALKIGVADKLAPVVERIFDNPGSHDGGTLALGSVYFAFQIYGDFCGYSTIAIGIAKILGVELMTNFSTPYFATSPQDFWRRWHISLSTFFRDYLYIPLGGSRTTPLKADRNALVTFTVSGLWHGANWTFIVWGFYHGLLLVLQRRLAALRLPRLAAAPATALSMGLTFVLVCIGWVLFRSPSLAHAFGYLAGIVSRASLPQEHRSALLYVLLAVAIDYIWRNDTRLETVTAPGPRPGPRLLLRWTSYVLLFWIIVTGIASREGVQQFIYFQF
ncbi:MAG: MBOAT family O-acyltransferase [Steroidobacteraceae bacterium]